MQSDNAFGFSRFLVFSFHPDREITENLFTVTENILRKKTFVHPLGLRRNVIAGTKWAIPSGQYGFILPARVANHSAEFGSSCGACHIINIYIYIMNSVLRAFWLVLTSDLLKGRRVDDDSARFKMTALWFLWTNQNALIRKATNEFASFCIENRLRQMTIFTILSKWKRIRSTRFWLKQTAFCLFII